MYVQGCYSSSSKTDSRFCFHFSLAPTSLHPHVPSLAPAHRPSFSNPYISACPVHWIVNYELEKRFEEARVKLRETMGREPEEKQLFHGTSAENIDS